MAETFNPTEWEWQVTGRFRLDRKTVMQILINLAYDVTMLPQKGQTLHLLFPAGKHPSFAITNRGRKGGFEVVKSEAIPK